MSLDSLQDFDMQPKAISSLSKPKPKPAAVHRPLRVLDVNCQSLCRKKCPLYNLMDSTKPDIVIATETWFDSSIADSEFFNSQFTVHRRDRRTHAGGVIVAVNSDYQLTRGIESLECDDIESVWVKINITGCKSFFFEAITGPSLTMLQPLKTLILCCKRSSKNTVAAPKTPYVNLHYTFADILADNGLTQMVEEPTRGDNTLELIMTNRPHQINRTQVLPGISDHEAVNIDFDINPTRKKQIPRYVPLYSKADWDGFRRFASNLADRISAAELSSSTEELWILFRDDLSKGIQSYIPHRRTKSRDSQPWISLELKRKIRRIDKAFKASKKYGKMKDEHRFLRLKKEVQRDLRRSYWQYVEDIVTPQDSDRSDYSSIKRFWTFIKHKNSDFSNISPLKVAGRLITDSKMKAETLNRQFQSESDFNFTPSNSSYISMPSINITVPGVEKLLKKSQTW
ncbi:uncharacterized protein [Amphiura filiformis]|uniref:uncharacterized protein n=1 Tax=Amphiura filiformis TaxID=82378 RepID=UPI003B21DDAF